MRKLSLFSITGLGLLFLSIGATTLQADEKVKSRMVFCDKGQDPTDILNREFGSERLEITLVGTCPGFTVSRDDVRIEGNDEFGCPASGSTVSGTISFLGAQRATVACLVVTGEGNGIEIDAGSSVLIIDAAVSSNVDAGVAAIGGANLALSRSQVLNNGGPGVTMNSGVSASIENTEIVGNGAVSGADDLFLSLHSTAAGSGNTIGAIRLRLDSGVELDGSVGEPVNCEDTESSALINGAVPDGCTGF